jgi:hypothetical protein
LRGVHVADADPVGEGVLSAGVVAGQYGNVNAKVAELLNGFGGFGAKLVADADRASDRSVLRRDLRGRLAGLGCSRGQIPTWLAGTMKSGQQSEIGALHDVLRRNDAKPL